MMFGQKIMKPSPPARRLCGFSMFFNAGHPNLKRSRIFVVWDGLGP